MPVATRARLRPVSIADLELQAERHLPAQNGSDIEMARPMPGLLILRHLRPTTLEATIYDPVICLILRGEKQTMLGERSVRFGAGESLIVSHSLPVVSRITKASSAAPYLALISSLDLSRLRSLQHELGDVTLTSAGARSLEVGKTDLALLDAFARYLALADEPIAARVLAPRVLDEIHFRLLLAPHGAMLRQLIAHDSQARGVGRAIEHIRREFKQSLAMSDLAKIAGMSTSSFYKHFKSIAATSPLQYQKDLRLLEARRLLRTEGHTVSGAAYEVGYESPTQFSREYARKFGQPPRTEMTTA